MVVNLFFCGLYQIVLNGNLNGQVLLNFFHNAYSSNDAIKLSMLSKRTMPASCPLSASFIAARVSAFGIYSFDIDLATGLADTILTPCIWESTPFNCSINDGLSICNVNCAITFILLCNMWKINHDIIA